MDEDRLVKFVKMMSKNITDSDLELVNLGKSLGLDLVLFADLRESQEDEFADIVRQKALEKMEKDKDHYLSNIDSFFAGSIDFMVCDEPGGKKFFLLETNGGSNRGLSILTEKQQSIMYDGYFEAIAQALKTNKRGELITKSKDLRSKESRIKKLAKVAFNIQITNILESIFKGWC